MKTTTSVPAGKCESARLRVPPWLKSAAAMRCNIQPSGKSQKFVQSVDVVSTTKHDKVGCCTLTACNHSGHNAPGLRVGTTKQTDTFCQNHLYGWTPRAKRTGKRCRQRMSLTVSRHTDKVGVQKTVRCWCCKGYRH